ncbi:hypothetical protein MADRUGA_42 [Mycobacterium phage Madruga]|uniref:Uncharacterized protein n=1 Tax=Mycobacterium phage Madruga TaxID=1675552 RepID=A0A0K1LS04_9CAUD|nr:hypothetical protein MADRUGA_42 [Mycobacterium phage Madruga]
MIEYLDAWWEKNSSQRRYDRGPMYFWVMFASLLTAISMILTGPIPNGSISELNESEQIILAWTLLVGATISTFASLTGSRFLFPHWTRVKSYSVGLIGVPLVSSSFSFYAYALYINTANITSGLSGTLVPCLALGSAINGVYFFLEIRRIQRNVKFLKETDPYV